MDAEALRTALAPLLAESIPGFLELSACERLTGGASQETWRLSVATDAGASLLCLRRNSGAVAAGEGPAGVSPSTEARLMQAALAAGIPEPVIHRVLVPDDELGEGFIMQWLQGEALGGRIVHSSRFAGTRPRLAYQCGEILARIHAIDLEATGLGQTLHTATPEQLVLATWEQYQGFETPQPMIDYTARWLLEHLPPPAEAALVHGDFRNGNLMVDPDTGIIGVLDWELAAIGDPMRDLGWLCTNSWRFGRPDLPVGGFGRLDDLLAGYAAGGGRPVDHGQLLFWTVFGSFWWSVCCLIMAQSYRSGDNPSLERPAIGRRASEGQADCISLLLPGASVLPPMDSVDSGELPRADELLDSVATFLAADASEQLAGATRYLARVAANSLAIVGREQRLGEALRAAERNRLKALVDCRDSLGDLRRALVDQLRSGLALDTPGLDEHLRNTVQGQLSIDQPGYPVAPNRSVSELWEAYIGSLADPAEALSRGYSAWHFCDNPADADTCAELVMAGRKRATASAQWAYQAEGQALPRAGELSIVTDWSGVAQCVIRTTAVEITPFDEVSAAFAAMEGEGDGSLEAWREVHWRFFAREAGRWGRPPSGDMPVVCEQFERVYP